MKSNSSKKSAVRSLGGIQSVKKDVLDAVDPSSKVEYDPLPSDDQLNIGMNVMVSKEGQLYQKGMGESCMHSFTIPVLLLFLTLFIFNLKYAHLKLVPSSR